VLTEIQQHTPFQGSDTFDNIGWGESVYQPATTNLLRNDFVVKPEDMREVRRIAQAIAESGMFLNAHVEMETRSTPISTCTRRSRRSSRSRACAGHSRTSTR
jgi:hypothetical protein